MRRSRRLTVRQRLVVWTLVAAVAVLGGAIWAAATVVDRQLRHQIDEQLADDVKGAIVAQRVLTPDQMSAFNDRDIGGDYTVVVVDADGARVYERASGVGDVTSLTGGALVLADLQERGDAPFTVRGGSGVDQRVAAWPVTPDRYIVFARSLEQVEDTVASLRARIAIIGGVALVVLGVLVSLVGRAVVRPLERIIDGARAIGGGDLGRRIPDEQPDVESERLAASLNAMLDRLARAFDDQQASERQLREFVSDASHELRTPLATIRASAELLKAAGATDEDRARSAQRIESQSARMGRLIDDLILLARLQRGEELERAPVDLVAVAADAVDRARAREPQRPLDLVLATSPVIVVGDGARLEQALDDLLVNVAVHTPSGTGADVRVRVDGDEAVLEVADRGPGIPTEELDLALDRFWRGDASRSESRPGSGLGLAIARGVVSSHGGHLALRSSDGLTVEIRLPLGARQGGGSVRASDPPRPDAGERADDRVGDVRTGIDARR